VRRLSRRGAREGAAAQLFGIEAERGLLGGVLACGKGAWLGLGGELVAEAGEVLEIGHVGPRFFRYGVLGLRADKVD